MQIILFREKRGRAQSHRVPAGLVLGAAIAFFAALGASVYLGYRYAQSDLLDDQVIAAWQVRLEGQQHEIGRLRETSKAELNAVGRRLASMQARLLRMEALGERMTEVAKLDTGEFSFGEIPALGGPENEVANATPSGPEFISSVDQLADQLRAREDELEVLESLLANRRFHEDVVLAGRPIEKGWMSSAFGRRVDPISGQMAWHAGVDFAGKAQAEVVAVASGVVTYAGERGGYGRMVEINHGGGYVTRYGHHEELLVSPGDVVKKGQLIGRMGSTGRSTGPHVHFEVLKNGKHVDPARYVARRRES